MFIPNQTVQLIKLLMCDMEKVSNTELYIDYLDAGAGVSFESCTKQV